MYEYSDRLLEYLTAELSLSDFQKIRIRPTAESFQQKMRSSMEAERNEIEDIFVPKGSGGPFSRRPENEMDRDGGPYSRKHPNNEGFTPTQQQRDKMDQISQTHRAERERYIKDFKSLISPALTNDQRARLETLDLGSPRGRNGDAVSRPAPAPRR